MLHQLEFFVIRIDICLISSFAGVHLMLTYLSVVRRKNQQVNAALEYDVLEIKDQEHLLDRPLLLGQLEVILSQAYHLVLLMLPE